MPTFSTLTWVHVDSRVNERCKALSLANFNEDRRIRVAIQDTGSVFRRSDALDFRSRTRNGLRWAAPSFYRPRPSRVRNCKLDPNDLLLAQNPRKPRYRLLFLVSALHSTDSTMIVRKARDLTPAKSEILLIPSWNWSAIETRQRIGGRERTAFLNSPLRRESGRIAFGCGLINFFPSKR